MSSDCQGEEEENSTKFYDNDQNHREKSKDIINLTIRLTYIPFSPSVCLKLTQKSLNRGNRRRTARASAICASSSCDQHNPPRVGGSLPSASGLLRSQAARLCFMGTFQEGPQPFRTFGSFEHGLLEVSRAAQSSPRSHFIFARKRFGIAG
jgi:hypothetical protein